MSTATLEAPVAELPQTMSTLATTRTPVALPALDRIVLTGFMGSGKTTTGRLLAEALGWTFLDLDHEIEARSGASVPEIFAQFGEPHFRRLESNTLATLLGRRRVVIALGGGAPEELGNRLLLEQTPRTAVVHLSAPFDVLLDRCRVQATQPGSTARPNLADLERAAVRFHQRAPLYDRLATHRVDTTTQAPTDTVQGILSALNLNRAIHK